MALAWLGEGVKYVEIALVLTKEVAFTPHPFMEILARGKQLRCCACFQEEDGQCVFNSLFTRENYSGSNPAIKSSWSMRIERIESKDSISTCIYSVWEIQWAEH